MARIKPAEPHGLDPVRRLIFASARRMYGRALEPTEVVAHHRPLLAGYSAITLASTRFAHSVADRHKELAMLRTAQLIGCEWCLDFGSMLARDSGIPQDDLRELALWPQSQRFDELDPRRSLPGTSPRASLRTWSRAGTCEPPMAIGSRSPSACARQPQRVACWRRSSRGGWPTRSGPAPTRSSIRSWPTSPEDVRWHGGAATSHPWPRLP